MSNVFTRIQAALCTLGKPTDQAGTPSRGQDFKPWDQRRLVARLQTYRPLTWFAKPKDVGPVACASKGWINKGKDLLECEFCHAKLVFPDKAPKEFLDKVTQNFLNCLSSSHQAHCPWRKAHCTEEVLAMSLDDPSATRSDFADRLQKLLNLDIIPEISVKSVKAVLGPDSVKELNAFIYTGCDAGASDNTSRRHSRKLTKDEKARLLALLGWGTETLHSESASGGSSFSASSAYSIQHLLGKQQQVSGHQQKSYQSLLRCTTCGSRVGLWTFLDPKVGRVGRLVEDDLGPSCSSDVVKNLTHTIAGGDFSSAAARSPAALKPFGSSSLPVFGLAASDLAPPSASAPTPTLQTPPAMPAQASVKKRAAAEDKIPVAPVSTKRARLDTTPSNPADTDQQCHSANEHTVATPRLSLGTCSSSASELDPLGQHQSWCPWVYHPVSGTEVKKGWPQIGWIQVLEVLLDKGAKPQDSPQPLHSPSLKDRMKSLLSHFSPSPKAPST